MSQETETKAVRAPEPPQNEATIDKLTADEPKIMKPSCPGCGADPIGFKRLRYIFTDGVVLETIFCNNPECRIVITAWIVGIEKPKTPR